MVFVVGFAPDVGAASDCLYVSLYICKNVFVPLVGLFSAGNFTIKIIQKRVCLISTWSGGKSSVCCNFSSTSKQFMY